MTIHNACLAFYLGNNPEAKPWDRLITVIDGSPFSHVELAVQVRDDVFDCYSSSPRDGGVRHKQMALNPSQWVLVPITIDMDFAMQFFEREQGRKYDWLGLVTTKIRFLRSSPDKWFCSELVMAMCQVPDSGNYGVKRTYQWAIANQVQPPKGGFFMGEK